MIQLVTSVYGLQKKEHDNSCLFYLVGGRFKNSAEYSESNFYIVVAKSSFCLIFTSAKYAFS